MICKKCHQDFDVTLRLSFGDSDGESVEVRTVCPHCNAGHYTYTHHNWAAIADVNLFIAHSRANAPGGERN